MLFGSDSVDMVFRVFQYKFESSKIQCPKSRYDAVL